MTTKIAFFTHRLGKTKDTEYDVNNFMITKDVQSVQIVPAMTESGEGAESWWPQIMVVYRE